jgi:glycosyltransferase involved in cell wall biosynthesis
MALYGPAGQRRTLPPLVFGLGVFVHLLLHGRRYDVVHTASFPYFSLLAAGALRPLQRFGLVVDWHEVWTLGYWQEYLGRAGGRTGWLVQRLCARIPQRAFCFARLTERRLREEGLRGEPTVLEGEYAGGDVPPERPEPARPVVVFAGRHIPEKRVPALVDAMALLPDELSAQVFGDGPEREEVKRRVEALGLGGRVEVPGFVDPDARHLPALVLAPLAQRQVGDVVALRGETFSEVPVEPLSPADRVRVETVVDDADPQLGSGE